MKKRTLLSLLLGLVVMFAFARASQAIPYTKGDLFADVGGGIIKEFTPTGTLVQTLNTTHPGEGDGMAFDSSGNHYATSGFAANTVVKFDNSGNLITANFGSGYTGHPESVVIDNTNKLIYIGQPDGDHTVRKFDLNGNPVAPVSFSPQTQNRGTDWIDLESNLHIIRYTSEGNTIFRYDLATSTQLPNFATVVNLGSPMSAHRILSDGGELVAATDSILRLDNAGNVVKTYTIPGTSVLFAINLDPDGTSFWTADYFSGQVFKVDIATGTILENWNAFVPGQSHGVLGGLAVFGEITQGGGGTVPEPSTMLLLGSGLVGLAGYARKRMKK